MPTISALPTTSSLNTTDMVPIVQSGTTKRTTPADFIQTATSFTSAGSGAVSRTPQAKMRERLSVKDFGATGDGTTDDTTAIQAAITYSMTLGRKVAIYFPGGTYRITAPLVIPSAGGFLEGEGQVNSVITCSTNFSALVQIAQAGATLATNATFINLGFTTTGTTTRCIFIHENSHVATFFLCEFTGDLAGDLVYSNGHVPQFTNCQFFPAGASTWSLNLDCYNENPLVANCMFGPGSGNGVRITNTYSPANRVEGLRLTGCHFVNTGAYNVYVGNSLLTILTSNVLDQAGTASVFVAQDADAVTVSNNWVGSQSPHTATGILIAAGVENVIISENHINVCQYGIALQASVTHRTSGVVISDNVFAAINNISLSLDSVANCHVTGNVDRSGGGTFVCSWVTSATFGSGSYTFDNNDWASSSPAAYHTGSTYRFGNDRGVVGRNRGTNRPGAAVTTLTISHGCFRTPSRILITGEGHQGNYAIDGSSITSTQFTVIWTGAADAIIHWDAEV